MRHRKKGKRLNRHSAHRKALINNIVKSVFKYQKVETTLAKAKLARQLIEKLITKAKQGNLNSYRSINQVLNDRDLTKLVVDKISPRFKDRNSGYTRIVHVGSREGDNSSMAILELTVKEEKPKPKKVDKKLKKEAGKEAEVKPKLQDKQPKEKVKKEKPKKFVENLRKFFKRKTNP